MEPRVQLCLSGLEANNLVKIWWAQLGGMGPMGWPANMAKGSGEHIQGLQDALLASTALFTDTETEA